MEEGRGDVHLLFNVGLSAHLCSSAPTHQSTRRLSSSVQGPPLTESEQAAAAAAAEALSRAAFEDIFTDSKFLKQGEFV